MAESEGLPRKTIQIDGNAVAVSEPEDLPIQIGEVVVEARLLANGVLALSLGHFVLDLGGEPEIRVNSRLRITPEVLAFLEHQIANWRTATAQSKKAAN